MSESKERGDTELFVQVPTTDAQKFLSQEEYARMSSYISHHNNSSAMLNDQKPNRIPSSIEFIKRSQTKVNLGRLEMLINQQVTLQEDNIEFGSDAHDEFLQKKMRSMTAGDNRN